MGSPLDKMRTGTPEDPAKKGPQVRRVLPGETLKVWPLEERAGWYVTHFLGQLTRPCLGDECICHSIETPVRTRWAGWILVAENFRPLLVRLLALTENCWDSCEELRRADFNWRGRMMILTRPKGGFRGRVYVKVDDVMVRHPESMPKLPYTHKDQLLKVYFTQKHGYDEFNQYAHSAWVAPDEVISTRQVETREA